MKYFVLFTLLIVAAQSAPQISLQRLQPQVSVQQTAATKAHPSGKIVNGNVAYHGQFPFQALVIFDDSTRCGGSLISSMWVLTSAYCGYNKTKAEIHLGAQDVDNIHEIGRVILTSTEIIINPNFTMRNTWQHDIAIIRLPESVSYTDYVYPIKLPSGFNTFTGETGVVPGWGITSEDTGKLSYELRYTQQIIIENRKCDYSGITDNQVCAIAANNNSSPCVGDNGDPLTIGDIQIGIFSFNDPFGCATSMPTGYTRLTHYRDWIRETTGI